MTWQNARPSAQGHMRSLTELQMTYATGSVKDRFQCMSDRYIKVSDTALAISCGLGEDRPHAIQERKSHRKHEKQR